MGLDRGDTGTRFGGGAGARFGQLGGNRVAAAQALAALGFVFAADGGGAGLLQLGFEAADLSLERTWVDLEQQIAFFHLGAFGEGHLVDLPGDARAHLDGFRCLQAAGELVPFVDRLFQYLGHADLGRRRRLHGLRGATAGTHHQYSQ
ncbi:hypothetical protein D3C77_235580 [compost metagenome]